MGRWPLHCKSSHRWYTRRGIKIKLLVPSIERFLPVFHLKPKPQLITNSILGLAGKWEDILVQVRKNQ